MGNDGNWESTFDHLKQVSLWEPMPADTSPGFSAVKNHDKYLRGFRGSKKKPSNTPPRNSTISMRSEILMPRLGDDRETEVVTGNDFPTHFPAFPGPTGFAADMIAGVYTPRGHLPKSDGHIVESYEPVQRLAMY